MKNPFFSRKGFFRALPALFLLTALAAQAQIRLDGVGTVPPSPAFLKSGDLFAIGSKGNGSIAFPDGSVIMLKEGVMGALKPDGMRIEKGVTRFLLPGRNQRFIVSTPQADLLVRGTDFDLSVTDSGTTVSLREGSLEGVPTTGKGQSALIGPGQTWTATHGQPPVLRSTRPEDLAGWGKAAGPEPPSTIFTRMFPYGLVTCSAGKITVIMGPGGPEELASGSVIPIGSTLETLDGAEITLGCGSTIRLGPGTRVIIRTSDIEIGSGSVLLRHLGSLQPLKITGKSTFLISRDSVVDVIQAGDSLAARVQGGKILHPGLARPITEGNTIQMQGRKAFPMGGPFILPEASSPAVGEADPGVQEEDFFDIEAEFPPLTPDAPLPPPESESPETPPPVEPATDPASAQDAPGLEVGEGVMDARPPIGTRPPLRHELEGNTP